MIDQITTLHAASLSRSPTPCSVSVISSPDLDPSILNSPEAKANGYGVSNAVIESIVCVYMPLCLCAMPNVRCVDENLMMMIMIEPE